MKNISKGYQNKTYEEKFNPKKNNKDKRKRPKYSEPKSSLIAVERKSVAGVKYVTYKFVFPTNPSGYNRAARRAELAKRRKS